MNKSASEPWQEALSDLGKNARRQAQAEAEAKRQAQAALKSEPGVNFAQAVGAVVPVNTGNRIARPAPDKSIPLRRDRAEADEDGRVFVGTVSDYDDTPPRQYCAGGQGKNDLKKLLSRQFPITSTLDLHGYNQEEAQEVLNEFIEHIRNRRGVVGEIIHGSGLGSRGFAPVLKTLVRRWLMAHPQVLAYTEPSPSNDGSVLILLKRRPREDTE